MNLSNMRPGQGKATDTVIDRLIRGEDYSSVIAPTRYGKSDIIRTSALIAHVDGLASFSLALSVNELLRDQLVRPDKLNEWMARYAISKRGLKVGTLKRLPKGGINPNREFLLSATIQLVQRNVDIFGELFLEAYEKTGLPVWLPFDEAHTGSEDNTWGETIRILVEKYHAKAAVFTAWSLRADGRVPIGFRARRTPGEHHVQYRTRPSEKPGMIVVDRYEGEKCAVEIEADCEITFAEAWAEIPPPLLQIDHFPFDVALGELTDAGPEERRMLSGLSLEDTRRMLPRIVRDRQVIRKATRLAAEALRIARARNPRASAIVFCGNDEGPENERKINEHATAIRAAFEAIDPAWRVTIATHADGDGKKKIEDFVGDILIVKQMASLGLDVDHLMVGLDLSTTRAVPAMIQRYNRVTTPFDRFDLAVMISPADRLTTEFFDTFVAKQGGGKVIRDLVLVETYEKPKEDRPARTYVVRSVEGADFRDTRQNEADGMYHESARRLFVACPQLALVMSRAEAMNGLKANDMSIVSLRQDSDETINVDNELDELYHEINQLRAEITLAMIGGYAKTPEKQAEYREMIRKVSNMARMRAGIDPEPELRELRDIQVVTRLRDELAKMAQGVERDHGT